MKIIVIAPFTFGYIDALVQKLSAYPGVEVIFINFDEFTYQYSGIAEKTQNFLFKIFQNKNIKKEYKNKMIREVVAKNSPANHILVVRPDRLNHETLEFLTQSTQDLICYCFDAIDNIPAVATKFSFFNRIFSYEKEDVVKFKVNYVPNFIPFDSYTKNTDEVGVFNISSFDNRFPLIEKIAQNLKEQNYPYRILIRKEKPQKSDYLEIVSEYIPLAEVYNFLESSKIILDIQKENQKGLSFRIMEALGMRKKLITTNPQVVKEDFFDPDNILLLDKDNPVIPREFLEKEYVELPESILEKYSRESWIKTVFNLEK